MVNTKPPSSAANANNASSKKTAAPSKDQSDIIYIRDVTASLLKDYFPILNGAPNILYICMATWGFESSFRIHPNGVNSIHSTATLPKDGNWMKADYAADPIIRNILIRPNLDVTTKNNIEQGYHPHGLSACMGAYHVKGTKANRYMFGPNKAVASSLGLEVEPGQSITSLFPASEVGIRRSIASGLIAYDQKYKTALSLGFKGADAVAKAIAWYVGQVGIPDNNNFKPEQRVAQIGGRPVSSKEASILSILSDIGLTPDNTYVASTTGSISKGSSNYTANKGKSTNKETRVADASTSAKAEELPGCV